MDIFDIINGLEKVLPIIGTATGNPELGVLAAKLLDMSEQEIQRRMASSGRTRSEELADAQATYAQFRKENAELKALGHE